MSDTLATFRVARTWISVSAKEMIPNYRSVVQTHAIHLWPREGDGSAAVDWNH